MNFFLHQVKTWNFQFLNQIFINCPHSFKFFLEQITFQFGQHLFLIIIIQHTKKKKKRELIKGFYWLDLDKNNSYFNFQITWNKYIWRNQTRISLVWCKLGATILILQDIFSSLSTDCFDPKGRLFKYSTNKITRKYTYSSIHSVI